MKNTIKIATVLILLISSQQSEAQFFKKLQKKIENKIERRIEKKADQKADQALDSVLTDRSSKKRKKSTSPTPTSSDQESLGDFNLGEMMEAAMNRKPAEYDDTYSFNLTTVMEMTTQQSKPMKMTTSYGDTAYFVQVDQGTSIITDFKNDAMITLNEDKKTAQAMSMSLMRAFDKESQEKEVTSFDDLSVKKTGKTKTIRGYQCEQYLISDTDFTSEGWFTKEVNFDFASYAKSMSELFKSNSSQAIVQGNIGFPIEMTSVTKQGDKVTMKILEIQENEKNINLTSYKVSQL